MSRPLGTSEPACHLLILDIRMPDADWIELYGWLREIDRRIEMCSISTFIVGEYENSDTYPARVSRQRLLLYRKTCNHVKAGADVKFQLSLPQYQRSKQE